MQRVKQRVRELLEKGIRVSFKIYNNVYCRADSNSGDYAFYTDMVPVGDGVVEIRYGTSSEFPFCPVFGGFRDCYFCRFYDAETDTCTAKFKQVTIDEAVALAEDMGDGFDEYYYDVEDTYYFEEQCSKNE